jgi:hypothetical protein
MASASSKQATVRLRKAPRFSANVGTSFGALNAQARWNVLRQRWRQSKSMHAQKDRRRISKTNPADRATSVTKPSSVKFDERRDLILQSPSSDTGRPIAVA